MIETEVKQIPYCEKCRIFKPKLKSTVYFAGDMTIPEWWIECENLERCKFAQEDFEEKAMELLKNKDMLGDSESESSDIMPAQNEPPESSDMSLAQNEPPENHMPLKDESYILPVRESNRKGIVMATVITMAVSVIAMIAFYVVIALTK